MATPRAILPIVAEEPALLRWLHSHDPDRDMSAELLKVSATYISSVPLSDTKDISPVEVAPTASLIVPMYARKHFVLGQLYGPMSPNSMALNMLAHAGFGSPPHPICRRFVVDLSYPDALAFLEYEWLSDGKLCVSMHNVTYDGRYSGESVLLASPTRKDSDPVMEKGDLLSKNRAKHPTKIIMKVRFDELPRCMLCGANGTSQCTCPLEMRGIHKQMKAFSPPSNWETWLAAFTKSRSGPASMKVMYTVILPHGNHDGQMEVTLQQDCELGVEPTSPQGSQLLKMFFSSADMLVSHPCTDDTVRAAEEKRDRIEFANALSEDENWTQPQVVVVKGEEETAQTSDGCSVSEQPVGSSTINDSDRDAGVQIPMNSFVESNLPPSRHPLNGKITQSWKTHLEPQTASEPPTASEPLTASERQTASDGGISGARNCDASQVEGPRQIQKSTTNTAKRKGKQKQKLFVCECGKIFRHKGHYNEHRLCVHEKVREHQCEFANCQSRFFKRSDRDRHMRSKHDSSFGT